MKIFIDINHPAHVHYFKNLIKILKNKGYIILVSARNRYPVQELLEYYNIKYFNRGKGATTRIGKLIYMLFADLFLLIKAKKFNPDVFLCFGGVYLTHVAKLIGKPSIFLYDTDTARFNHNFYLPFATHILTPNVFKYNFGKKHIRFNSYMELCYLHQKYFKPNRDIFNLLGIAENTPYVILRFVSWNANHDFGHKGINNSNKIKVVREFTKYAKVFISSEGTLPNEIENFRIKIPPHKMHDALAFAKLLYGESATMASESVVLGVPAIYLDNDGRCYTSDQENNYGLVFNFTESIEDQEASIQKGIQILKENKDYQLQREQLLNDKIDLTQYLVWFLKNYPNSVKVVQKNPDYQNRFNEKGRMIFAV